MPKNPKSKPPGKQKKKLKKKPINEIKGTREEAF
jgi:hypothetical protein